MLILPRWSTNPRNTTFTVLEFHVHQSKSILVANYSSFVIRHVCCCFTIFEIESSPPSCNIMELSLVTPSKILLISRGRERERFFANWKKSFFRILELGRYFQQQENLEYDNLDNENFHWGTLNYSVVTISQHQSEWVTGCSLWTSLSYWWD